MKNLYSLIIGLFLGALICYLYLDKKNVSLDDEKLNQKIDSLRLVNTLLNDKINEYDVKIKSYESNIDSLEQLNRRIKLINLI